MRHKNRKAFRLLDIAINPLDYSVNGVCQRKNKGVINHALTLLIMAAATSTAKIIQHNIVFIHAQL